MGQKVNPKLYRLGISNFWSENNYPTDQKFIGIIDYNYLFELLVFFFNIYNIQVYFFKSNFIKDILNLYVFVYKYMYTKKRKFYKKKLNKFNYFIKC
jgi:hypothetical protein